MAFDLRQQINVAVVLTDYIVRAIYAYAPTGETTFAECQQLASPDLMQAWSVAKQHVTDLQEMAIESGLAVRHPLDEAVLRWNDPL